MTSFLRTGVNAIAWLPISTAPTDGSAVRVAYSAASKERQIYASYKDGKWCECKTGLVIDPIQWSP